MNGLWEQLLTDSTDHRTRRLAWRTMRQFADPGQLAQEFELEPRWLWSVAQQTATQPGDAVKLLLAALPDCDVETSHPAGCEVRCETVVLFPPGPSPMHNSRRLSRATACISSQPGCGVGCPFCLTASLGYRGNLSSSQIIEQVYWAGMVARQRGRRLRNVVFMGMGEPLHNTSAVLEALAWLTAPRGFGLSPRHITVSTAGVPAAMVALAERFPRVRLALSLHSADTRQRRELVPRAHGDLAVLQRTIAQVNALQVQPLWIELVLFDRLNDSLDHAQQLVTFCGQLRVEVNLIPYNAAGNVQRFVASPRERREAFAQVLREAGIRTTIRSSLGGTDQAACGQLTAERD